MGSLRDMPQDKGVGNTVPTREPEEEINPKIRCQECQWVEMYSEEERRTENADGECRKKTPTKNSETGRAEWPKILKRQWCSAATKNDQEAEMDEYLIEAKRMLYSYASTRGIVQGRRADFCMKEVIKAANENRSLRDALESIVWALKRWKPER